MRLTQAEIQETLEAVRNLPRVPPDPRDVQVAEAITRGVLGREAKLSAAERRNPQVIDEGRDVDATS
jgi:hypothetical protein